MSKSFRSPLKVMQRLRFLPLAVRRLRNWQSFIYHYALGLQPEEAYRFRNGAHVMIGRALEHVPIIEIFLKEEYGKIADGSIVLDLGANVGVFSIYATSSANNLQVYAYEPFPAFASLLRENIRRNGKENQVRCFELAVAGQSGRRSLHLPEEGFFFPGLVKPTSYRSGPAEMMVECTTLEQIINENNLSRVDLLKMDCEGAEYEILYATPVACLEKIREIRMEYHNLKSAEEQIDQLENYLAVHGFVTTEQKASSPTNGILWLQHSKF